MRSAYRETKGRIFFFKPSDKSVLETGKEGDVGDGNIKYFWERLVFKPATEDCFHF